METKKMISIKNSVTAVGLFVFLGPCGAQAAPDCLQGYMPGYEGMGPQAGESCTLAMPNYGNLTGVVRGSNASGVTSVFINGLGVIDVSGGYVYSGGGPVSPSNTSFSNGGCNFAMIISMQWPSVDVYTGVFSGTIRPLQGASCQALLASNPASRIANSTGSTAAEQLRMVRNIQNATLDAMVYGTNATMPAARPGVFSGGFMHEVKHDAYKLEGPETGIPNTSFNATEASMLGSAQTELPGQFLGGDVRLGYFQGYGGVSIGMGRETGENNSGFIGGYGLYRLGGNYSMLSLSGSVGYSKQYLVYTDIFGQAFPYLQSYSTYGFSGAAYPLGYGPH
jgi:hypothetical protein